MLPLPPTFTSSSLRALLKISEDPVDRGGPWIPPVAEVEDEPRISDGISSETGWCSIVLAQELLYFSEQIHLSVLIALCDSAAQCFPTQFLLV
jgi:hypothetical protein